MSEEADRLLQPEPFERDQYDKQVEDLLPCQHYLACLGDLGIHDAECWAYRRIPVAAALRGLAAEKDAEIERLKNELLRIVLAELLKA